MLYIPYSCRRTSERSLETLKQSNNFSGIGEQWKKKVKSDLLAPAFAVSFIAACSKKAVKIIIWADGGGKYSMPAPVSSLSLRKWVCVFD
jgi:hypothetical protein